MPPISSLTLAADVANLPLLTTLAAGFAAAWLLGIVTQKLKLSPIVGYLLAGVLIGPYTPGFTGDPALAQQLAEVGVILLMFGVGLHFHLKDLLAVKNVAIPGAIGQSALATVAAVVIFMAMGWTFKAGIVLGMAMAVASTVVLLRVLMDRSMLNTSHGHVAVGWLIVEDILTVLLLVLIPLFAVDATGAATTTATSPWLQILFALLKLIAMVLVVFVIGSRVIPVVLNWVARQRSSELFTLTVLVLSIAIAVGAAVLFGASVALGAFLAGMVVAQSRVSHQAAADALPMRHAFAVLFFVSVGMLLDPKFIIEQPLLLAAGLGVVLIVKPLAAMLIVAICGYPPRTALTVAIGLAQIGEFSFIVGQAALQHNLIPQAGMQVLVASAMISITINPLLFRSLDSFEAALRNIPWLWKLLSARYEKRIGSLNEAGRERIEASTQPLAIIAGYGPVGRVVDAMLRDAKINTVIIDMNVDTVRTLERSGRTAIFGDAMQQAILTDAGITKASHLIVTLPSSDGLASIVLAAKELNPDINVIVRARYLAEGDGLRAAGASHITFEEGETGVALARHVLERRGVDESTMKKLLQAIRVTWKMDGAPNAVAPALQANATAVPPSPSTTAPTKPADLAPSSPGDDASSRPVR
ncbi:MAG TPA: cation:proton antiporter [Phycisphaerales bacterium]|nr:cation:proton antiporter [Phycisphaerales bacterium]